MTEQPLPPGSRAAAADPGFAAAFTGVRNAITDVEGVRVGSTTIWQPDAEVLSGVTAITHDGLEPGGRLRAGFACANGYGKFVGSTQLQELGLLESPILLTSTLSTFRVADALVTWMLERSPTRLRSANPVVGEINDRWLSRGADRPVTAEHVFAALATASPEVERGSVGAGTGACALGFKGGIGTASRLVEIEDRVATVGALALTNMGGVLRLSDRIVTPESVGLAPSGPVRDAGSCVLVVAVDLPCSALDLSRLARRATFALGRSGAAYSHGSGDYSVAFSTAVEPPLELNAAALDLLFGAVLGAVEESVLDSLVSATTVTLPSGVVAHALSLDWLRELA